MVESRRCLTGVDEDERTEQRKLDIRQLQLFQVFRKLNDAL